MAEQRFFIGLLTVGLAFPRAVESGGTMSKAASSCATLLVWLGETIRPTRDADLLGTAAPADLGTVTDGIAAFVGPVLEAAGTERAHAYRWPPGGPWQRSKEPRP